MEKDVDQIVAVLRDVVWAAREVRRKIQHSGVNVIPANFYSNTPSIDDITSSYEYVEPAPPYLIESLFDGDALARTLGELTAYAGEFDPPLEGNEESCERFILEEQPVQLQRRDVVLLLCPEVEAEAHRRNR